MRKLSAFLSVIVAAFCVYVMGSAHVAEAAPKYVGTLTHTGLADAGASNTYRAPATQETLLLTCTQPYCYKTTYSTTGRVLPACATDFQPEVTTTTTSTDDAGLVTTIVTAIPYQQVDLGSDNSIAVNTLDGGAATCKVYYLPPVANSHTPVP